MLGLNFGRDIFFYAQPTDMRKSFDGLCGLIRNHLQMNPVTDGVFVFINRRRDRMKILLFDRHGFWLLYKRLEEGRFELPSASSCSLPAENLALILEGIDLSSIRRRKRFTLPC